MVIAYASAGLIGTAGIGLGHGGLVVAQPAAIAVKAGATSYQNNNLLAVHPVPVVAHAPVAVAHAPVAVAHAPAVALGLGHGLLH